ncbi:hypothetical protein SCHPADRAFT_992079 [Schizopora paradoxa]|uniref:Ceramide glucosyltransferase n=1 Tax=Schizopora paradoxa TaxID=27342 RepID=A0A0H2S936_9AGAM|nr:hypothetical protein SCHPADRAFT_992079 [Schizopora paradoxa]
MDVHEDDRDGSSSFGLADVLAIVTVVWYAAVWSISVLGCVTGRKRYRLRPRSPLSSAEPSRVPGVSIIRPLKGLDTNLFENLESTFTQDYPNFEVLLCVADAEDQALSVVRSLIEKYPHVDARAVVGEEVVGVNPKVNNLMRAYKEAKNDILWVLDSNVFVESGVCARSVDALLGPNTTPNQPPSSKRRIGLVHHVPFAFGSEKGWGSRVDEAFLNTNHAKMYMAINAVALESCVVGKSNMFRRTDIERLHGNRGKPTPHPASDSVTETGLASFGRYLAEDNMIGEALWHELGLRHELSCDVAGNVIGNVPLSGYIERRVRWIRVRKRMVMAATIVEPFQECIMLSIVASWSLQHLFGIPAWLVLLIHYPAWIWVDLDVYESLAGHPLPSERRLDFFMAWGVRELLAFPIWLSGIFGEEVHWRGRKYRMLNNGEVELVEDSAPRSHWSNILPGRRRKHGYSALNQNDDSGS